MGKGPLGASTTYFRLSLQAITRVLALVVSGNDVLPGVNVDISRALSLMVTPLQGRCSCVLRSVNLSCACLKIFQVSQTSKWDTCLEVFHFQIKTCLEY